MEIVIPKFSFRLEIIILIAILFIVLSGHLFCSCSTISAKEGMQVAGMVAKAVGGNVKEAFTSANTNYGLSAPYSVAKNDPVNTSSWFMPNLTYTAGGPISPGAQAILNRPANIPIPEGELDMFATTKFAPECCPTSYSNSMGCACMSVPQYTFLRERGLNNSPPDPEGY
jgi:hypothetical protein